MADNPDKSKGCQRLMDIFAEAVGHGADAIEMERDSGGSLEVCFMSGNTGVGFMLDRATANEVIDSLREKKKKSRGKKFRVTLDGKDYMVQVQTYDHFGENAYRLTLRPAKR